MTLTVDSARVIAAAKQCPDVARALKTLFPEAFQEEAVTQFKPGTTVYMLSNPDKRGTTVGGVIAEALYAKLSNVSTKKDMWIVGTDGLSCWNHHPVHIGSVWGII